MRKTKQDPIEWVACVPESMPQFPGFCTTLEVWEPEELGCEECPLKSHYIMKQPHPTLENWEGLLILGTYE